MAAALFLTGFNLWDESRARRAADRVTFTDVDENVFLYSVAEIQILQPGDVEEMLSGGWALTLFTCTLGGRTRVTVRCEEAADAGRGYGFSI